MPPDPGNFFMLSFFDADGVLMWLSVETVLTLLDPPGPTSAQNGSARRRRRDYPFSGDAVHEISVRVQRADSDVEHLDLTLAGTRPRPGDRLVIYRAGISGHPGQVVGLTNQTRGTWYLMPKDSLDYSLDLNLTGSLAQSRKAWALAGAVAAVPFLIGAFVPHHHTLPAPSTYVQAFASVWWWAFLAWLLRCPALFHLLRSEPLSAMTILHARVQALMENSKGSGFRARWGTGQT